MTTKNDSEPFDHHFSLFFNNCKAEYSSRASFSAFSGCLAAVAFHFSALVVHTPMFSPMKLPSCWNVPTPAQNAEY